MVISFVFVTAHSPFSELSVFLSLLLHLKGHNMQHSGHTGEFFSKRING